MKKRGSGMFAPPAIGGSAVLVMFAVLCLTTFAVLSLAAARSGERLAEKNAAAAADYYAADTAAEEIFACLRAGEVPAEVSCTAVPEGMDYRYTCPVSGTQALQVSILRAGEAWTVREWKTVSTADWAAEERLGVWDGETLG